MTRLARSPAIALALLACTIPMPADAAELSDLEQILERLLEHHDYPLQVELRIDEEASMGYAAIQHRGDEARISVHPEILKNWSLNTWGFVLGHELAHQLHQHGPDSDGDGADPEFEADITGALLARAAGYDVEVFLGELFGRDGCSASHGCMAERARRMELYLGLDLGLWTEQQQRTTELNHIVGALSDAPRQVTRLLFARLQQLSQLEPGAAGEQLARSPLPPQVKQAASAYLELSVTDQQGVVELVGKAQQRRRSSERQRDRAPSRSDPMRGNWQPPGNGAPSGSYPGPGRWHPPVFMTRLGPAIWTPRGPRLLYPEGPRTRARGPVYLPGGHGRSCRDGSEPKQGALTQARQRLLRQLYGEDGAPEIVSAKGLAHGVDSSD